MVRPPPPDTIRSTCTDNYPIRDTETTYLDHAGTTVYAKSLITAFSRDMNSRLFGNPHSMSVSSRLSTQRTDDVRFRVLQFFNASPEEFDVVFAANTTAAIKLVADSLRDCDSGGFWYGYHVDSHTSVVGVREVAEMGYQCFQDVDVDDWIAEIGRAQSKAPRLFAFPAQSNMNGRRLPIRWCEQIRSAANEAGNVFTLLDAASFVSTAPLDLSNATSAPDFTALSFYKIFGFPDLGALIVRKSVARILERRKFFGGGTVDMVIASGAQWHAKRETSIHAQLEDGTLPFHSIIALDAAIDTHKRLYGSMANISAHTGFLAKRVYDQLSAMAHFNNAKVCHIYQSGYGNPAFQGPIIAFNLRNSRGEWIPKTEVERQATMQNIQLRSGSVCNPGGTALSLGWTSQELRRNYAAGLRCGDDHDVLGGRPTGILRISLGAMTNLDDIDSLTGFIEKFYVEKVPPLVSLNPPLDENILVASQFYVESMTVFPINGCGAFRIPEGKKWEIKRDGLAWDQEWYLVHARTGVPIKQREHPRMALIHPSIDMDRNVLRIACDAKAANDELSLEIPLTWSHTSMGTMTTPVRSSCQKRSVSAYGDKSCLRAYASPVVSAFFTDFLGVPCTLARLSSQAASLDKQPPHLASTWKDRLRRSTRFGFFSPSDRSPRKRGQKYLIVSSETSILIVSRSSVNCLNESIKTNTKLTSGVSRTFAAEVFQSNIVIAERISQPGRAEQPYVEDNWSSVSIGQDGLHFDTFDPCQRCQMICVDQATGVQRTEILAALPKTRKVDGKVLFGRYAAISTKGAKGVESGGPASRTIMVGDVVLPSYQID
jgi:molybdenum cofactor sulfurtransferase